MVSRDVLFVDDDPVQLRTLERTWQRSWRVHAVQSYEQALSFVARETVSYVVVDLFMPDGDGIKLIHDLKQRRRDLYAVLASAALSFAWAQRAAIADDVVAKPVDLNEIELRRSDPARRYDERVASLEETELAHAKRALDACGHNKTEAARRLRITRNRLKRILARSD